MRCWRWLSLLIHLLTCQREWLIVKAMFTTCLLVRQFQIPGGCCPFLLTSHHFLYWTDDQIQDSNTKREGSRSKSFFFFIFLFFKFYYTFLYSAIFSYEVMYIIRHYGLKIARKAMIVACSAPSLLDIRKLNLTDMGWWPIQSCRIQTLAIMCSCASMPYILLFMCVYVCASVFIRVQSHVLSGPYCCICCHYGSSSIVFFSSLKCLPLSGSSPSIKSINNIFINAGSTSLMAGVHLVSHWEGKYSYLTERLYHFSHGSQNREGRVYICHS